MTPYGAGWKSGFTSRFPHVSIMNIPIINKEYPDSAHLRRAYFEERKTF